jgi:hypothetical protein
MSNVLCATHNDTIRMSAMRWKIVQRQARQTPLLLGLEWNSVISVNNGAMYLLISQHYRGIKILCTLHFVSFSNLWVLGPSFLDKKLRKKDYSPSFGLVRVVQAT